MSREDDVKWRDLFGIDPEYGEAEASTELDGETQSVGPVRIGPCPCHHRTFGTVDEYREHMASLVPKRANPKGKTDLFGLDRKHDIRYRPRTAKDGEWFLEAECACGWVKPFDPIGGWVSEAVLATACVRHRMQEEREDG